MNVLTFSGLDPSGGAGLVADIETLHTHKINTLAIATVLTAQNSQIFKSTQIIKAEFIQEQYQLLIKEHSIDAIKLGLLGDNKQLKIIASILEQHAVPIICDPIIRSSSGQFLMSDLTTFKRYILPKVTLLTPNKYEYQTILADDNHLTCPWVLVTAGDDESEIIHHQLLHQDKLVKTFSFKKQPFHYHGSGCTLASNITAFLVKGNTIENACEQGLIQTEQALLNAKKTQLNNYRPTR